MKYISYIINSIFVLLMLAVAGLFLAPMLPLDNNFELRIVQSGSMEPDIMTGSLIAVVPKQSYQPGDVVMFGSSQTKVPTTHRIVETYSESGQTWFTTKGDANEDPDNEPVSSSEVIGKVMLDVPRVGFLLDFTRQPTGFALLIALPALLIILSEIEKIWRELRRKRKPDSDDPPDVSGGDDDTSTSLSLIKITKHASRMMDIATPVRYLNLPTLNLKHLRPYTEQVIVRNDARMVTLAGAILFVSIITATSLLGSTLSYFNDSEWSRDNALNAIALDFTAVPDGQIYNFSDGEIIDDDDGAVVVVVSPLLGSAELQYDVRTDIVGSSTPLCEQIIVDTDSPVNYAGPIDLLKAEKVEFISPWTIAFGLTNPEGLSADVCDVNLVFTAWHQSSDDGYYDEEIVPIKFNYLDTVAQNLASFSLQSPAFVRISTTTSTSTNESEEEVVGNKGTTTPIVLIKDYNAISSDTEVGDEEILEKVEPILNEEGEEATEEKVVEEDVEVESKEEESEEEVSENEVVTDEETTTS